MPRKRKVGRPKKKVAKRKVKRKRRSGGQRGDGFFDDVGGFLGNVVGDVKNSGIVGDALLATGNPLFSAGAKLLGFGAQQGKGRTGRKRKRKRVSKAKAKPARKPLTRKQVVVMASDPRMAGEGVFGDFLRSTAKQAVQVAKDNQLVSKALQSKGHGKLANLSRLGGFGQRGAGYELKTSIASSSR